jgi:hypothetical protein
MAMDVSEVARAFGETRVVEGNYPGVTCEDAMTMAGDNPVDVVTRLLLGIDFRVEGLGRFRLGTVLCTVVTDLYWNLDPVWKVVVFEVCDHSTEVVVLELRLPPVSVSLHVLADAVSLVCWV